MGATLLGLLLAATLEVEPLPRGAVIERVACRTDASQSYALYLPSACTARCPAILLMDPRGRAEVPMSLFRSAAEKRGYILMSSYGTASDGPWEPNAKAVGAMVPEAIHRHGADPRRIYLAGFSGTARVGWEFGLRLKEHVAGLIGFGGGLPFEAGRLKEVPFVFFGAAGRLDFNYEEMLALDAKLESLRVPHRFESFDGPHAWGPESICAEAVDWLEIQAMKNGLRPREASVVEEVFSRRRDEAEGLESAGEPHAAWLAWRSIARDFDGLRDVSAARTRAGELEGSKIVQRTMARRRTLAARQTAYEGTLGTFIQRSHTAAEVPPLGRSLDVLQIASLLRRAAMTEDPLDAQAAQRLLEMVFVHTSFYEPQRFLDQGEPDRALAMLQVAARIKPGNPRVLLGEARAQARAGRKDKAIDALRRAVEAGVVDPQLIESEEAFASLRGEAGYRDLLHRLRAPPP